MSRRGRAVAREMNGRVAAIAVAGATLALVVVLVAVAGQGTVRRALAGGSHQGTPTAGTFHVAIDCNASTTAVDEECTVPEGQTQLVAALTVANDTGVPVELGSFEFEMVADQTVLNPPATVPTNGCSGGTANPQFNCNFVTGASWQCLPAADEDIDPDPAVARSRIVCFNSLQDGPIIPPDGSHHALAFVHYNVVPFDPEQGDIITTLGLMNTVVSNENQFEQISCNPVIEFEAGGCYGATITIEGQEIPTPTFTPTATATPILTIDLDFDGVPDESDNCPLAANPGQENADGNFILQSPPLGVNDHTRANSDEMGDACDLDDDNDGIVDLTEPQVGPGGLLNLLCPSASAATNPLLADSDRDNVLDGAECELGTDPANAASRPPHAPGPDSDGDGLRDDIEVRGYGTNELVADTDADGCDDMREAASVDENTVVGASDLGLIAAAFGNYGFPAPEEWRVNMDVDKNGAVNAADLGLAAAAFGSCGVLP